MFVTGLSLAFVAGGTLAPLSVAYGSVVPGSDGPVSVVRVSAVPVSVVPVSVVLGGVATSSTVAAGVASAVDDDVSRALEFFEAQQRLARAAPTEFEFHVDDAASPSPYRFGIDRRLDDPEAFASHAVDALRAIESVLENGWSRRLEPKMPIAPIVVLFVDADDVPLAEDVEPDQLFGAGSFSDRTVVVWITPRDEYGVASVFRYVTMLRIADVQAARAESIPNRVERRSGLPPLAPWVEIGLTESWQEFALEYDRLRTERGDTRRFHHERILGTRYRQLLQTLGLNELPTVRDWMALRATEYLALLHGQESTAIAVEPGRERRVLGSVVNSYSSPRQMKSRTRKLGAAFFDYLRNAHDESYRPALERAIEAELSTGGGMASLVKDLCLENESDWADLDSDFREWLITDLRERALWPVVERTK